MTYRCYDCKAEFEEPDYREEQESFEFWGSVGRHTLVAEVCPECDSEDFDEIKDSEEPEPEEPESEEPESRDD